MNIVTMFSIVGAVSMKQCSGIVHTTGSETFRSAVQGKFCDDLVELRSDEILTNIHLSRIQ